MLILHKILCTLRIVLRVSTLCKMLIPQFTYSTHTQELKFSFMVTNIRTTGSSTKQHKLSKGTGVAKWVGGPESWTLRACGLQTLGSIFF